MSIFELFRCHSMTANKMIQPKNFKVLEVKYLNELYRHEIKNIKSGEEKNENVNFSI